jgi:Domain of unknown function (DUF4352)
MRRFLVSILLVTAATAVGCGSSTPTTQPAASVTVATSPPASSTSASLPTYGEVIGAYPSGARIVAIKANISGYDVYDDGSSYVKFAGEYKGVKSSGVFYLTKSYRYDGYGPLWKSYGDTHFYQPKSAAVAEWGKFRASCRALAKKDKAWADLYRSTYRTFLGPRFTADVRANIGELEVNPGDMLTFDSDQRLVKVSAWSSALPTASASPTTSASPTSGTTTSLHLRQNQAANVGGMWKLSCPRSLYLKSYRDSFAVVVVKMNNISSASQYQDPSSWSLTNSSGKKYQVVTGTVSWSGYHMLKAGNVAPGETVSGLVVYQVPRSGQYTLVFTNDSSTASWDIRIS